MKVAVVGGGVFGCMSALRLAEAGHSVELFERRPSLMMGASYNNQNRLHLGFHYPRDDKTAHQCILGFRRFIDEFASCVRSGFPNAYFIASKGSHTPPEDFLSFCNRLELRYEVANIADFRPHVRHVDLGIFTDEVVYDSALVRGLITERLTQSRIAIQTGQEVLDIARDGEGYQLSTSLGKGRFDAVVNCSYADINRLTQRLGHAADIRQYEYTAVPVIEVALDHPVGITIMDGRYMTLLPFGKSERYLLYHVDKAVIARSVAQILDHDWLTPKTAPFSRIDAARWFAETKELCAHFVPALSSAVHVDTLEGPRMVLPNRDETDERPSITTQHELGYITVFAGKIDHCVWVADEVVEMLAQR